MAAEGRRGGSGEAGVRRNQQRDREALEDRRGVER